MPDMSFEEIRKAVRDALSAGKSDWYGYVEECYDDYVVYSKDNKYFKASYTILDGKVTLGTSVEVKQVYKPITEACMLTESEISTEDRIIKNITIIKSGESDNRYVYPFEVLKRDGPSVFESARVYSGHYIPGDYKNKTDPRNLAGCIKDVRVQEADATLRGDFHYFADFDSQIEKAKEVSDLVGLSINVSARSSIKRVNNRIVRVVEAFKNDKTASVDMVVGPSAGGRIFEAINQEANELAKIEDMSLEELKATRPDLVEGLITEAKAAEVPAIPAATEPVRSESAPAEDTRLTEALHSIEVTKCELLLSNKLNAANLPADMAKKVSDNFTGQVFEAEKLDKEIEFFKGQAAKLSNIRVVEGERITIGNEPVDNLQVGMDLLFGVCDDAKGIKAFRGIREAYTAYTGDVDVTGHVRLTESFNSASLPYALMNSMTKRLSQDYKQKDWKWRRFASISSVPDFKTQDRVNLGYFGDIDDVDPETADYQELANFGDEKTSFALKQKGNIVPVTRKTIINDDLGAIVKIVSRLGRAAARTIAKEVYVNRLAAGTPWSPTPSDGSTTFFASNRTVVANRNLGSTALDAAAIKATLTLMKAYVEPSSGEKIGLDAMAGSVMLVVPSALYWTAVTINQLNGVETNNALFHFFGANNENIIEAPLLTDTTDWYLVFEKEEIDWMEIAFLQGREEPELFLADNPIVGDMLIADKLIYKIRQEFAVHLKDPRGGYKHAVTG